MKTLGATGRASGGALPRRSRRALLAAALGGATLGALGLGTGSAAAGSQRVPLFLIARSKNANVVLYDLMLEPSGAPRARDPLDVYWRLDASGGGREELSGLERRLAYGYAVSTESASRVELRLRAAPARSLVLEQRAVGGGPVDWAATLRIAGRAARLDRLYVAAAEGAVLPRVLHVDLFGRCLATGAALTERLHP